MTCGSKTRIHAKQASRMFAKILKKIGYEVRFRGYKVTTLLAKFDVKFPIRIEGTTTTTLLYIINNLIKKIKYRNISEEYETCILWARDIPRTSLSNEESKNVLFDICIWESEFCLSVSL